MTKKVLRSPSSIRFRFGTICRREQMAWNLIGSLLLFCSCQQLNFLNTCLVLSPLYFTEGLAYHTIGISIWVIGEVTLPRYPFLSTHLVLLARQLPFRYTKSILDVHFRKVQNPHESVLLGFCVVCCLFLLLF